ncbi:MAG: L-threonylcarbamoyladenylate synthase [Gammaproteobacteria bacterium]|nr:L-threonylcarbamoyladenylate synthase [Gammaproteobacteria bacterium]
MKVSPLVLSKAVRALVDGGVIAHPTESVWGLACDPANPRAVARLLELKNRPRRKGLILVSGCATHFSQLLQNLDREQRQRLCQTWPGPVTWLVPHSGLVSPWVCGDHQTVALRHTNHPFTAALTDAFGGAIISTSANPSGCQPAQYKFQVLRYFGDTLDYVGGGSTGGRNAPSEIRELIGGRVLRAGGPIGL